MTYTLETMVHRAKGARKLAADFQAAKDEGDPGKGLGLGSEPPTKRQTKKRLGAAASRVPELEADLQELQAVAPVGVEEVSA